MITKAVIPAAGFGSRFLPVTKTQPKEMLPVVDTPAIQMVVEEAVASGMHTLFQDGIRKVLAGITTIEEVLRIAAAS